MGVIGEGWMRGMRVRVIWRMRGRGGCHIGEWVGTGKGTGTRPSYSAQSFRIAAVSLVSHVLIVSNGLWMRWTILTFSS